MPDLPGRALSVRGTRSVVAVEGVATHERLESARRRARLANSEDAVEGGGCYTGTRGWGSFGLAFAFSSFQHRLRRHDASPSTSLVLSQRMRGEGAAQGGHLSYGTRMILPSLPPAAK